MSRPPVVLLAAVCLIALSFAALSSTACAGGDDPPEIDPKAVDAAVEKGVKYIMSQARQDGSFEGRYTASYPMGYNALCVLALLKGGADKDSRAVKSALAYLQKLELKKTYSVGLLLMALEAYYTPPKKKKKEEAAAPGPRTTLLEPAEKPRPTSKGRQWGQMLANWLAKAQTHSAWSYGLPSDSGGQGAIPRRDNSNTQYALLGLLAAKRLGCKVPDRVFESSLEYFLKMQETDGPDVAAFPVPASSDDIFRKEPENLTGKKDKPDSGTAPAPEGEAGAGPAGEKTPDKYKARGWDYATSKILPDPSISTYASMTAVGVACVIITKSQLVETSGFKKVRDKVNSAIEDGCAWMSKYYDPSVNIRVMSGKPRTERDAWPMQHYYFLYAVERCGVLSGCERFGEKYWYLEGAKYILDNQNADGTWTEKSTSAAGARSAPPQTDLCPTCFAILFLKRATVPLNQRPIYTGEDLFKPKKKEPPPPPPGAEEPGK
jgi:hypothetical protein